MTTTQNTTNTPATIEEIDLSDHPQEWGFTVTADREGFLTFDLECPACQEFMAVPQDLTFDPAVPVVCDCCGSGALTFYYGV